jgi:hypothetical protein
MKTKPRLDLLAWAVCALLTSSVFVACGDDGESAAGPTGPTLGTVQGGALIFNFSHSATDWHVHHAGSTMGVETDSGEWSGQEWLQMTGVEVGTQRFIAGQGRFYYFIQPLGSNGVMSYETDHGEWRWYYDSFFGFKVGDRGFIFGQSKNNNYWFVQEVRADGRLGSETASGTWRNYYGAHTPLYVNGQTYLFFQKESYYWFITHVSSDGTLSDVADGTWGNYWDQATSYQLNGRTFLVGHRTSGDWYIQRINSDGTMGDETDQGVWHNYYSNLTAFVSAGRAYLFGLDGDQYWFIQEVTADGKLGNETDNGSWSSSDQRVVAFSGAPSPDSFRYTIGWDLAKTAGVPARWSPMYNNLWSGATVFGGGAALADIDQDAKHSYDAVLVGIQDQPGYKRFYYKIGFNLDATGKVSSWSDGIYSPPISVYQQGGGADIGDIDRNGQPDLLLMYIDDPDQANSFRYIIGWNLDTNGIAESWSDYIQGPTIGWDTAGGGAALGDIDGDGCLDLLLMGVDNPSGTNDSYWYTIGRKMDVSGRVKDWSPTKSIMRTLGVYSQGAGAALADINGNGKLDLVLTDLDNPSGANYFRSSVGWDIDITGAVTGWSDFGGPSPGSFQSGGGAAVADIDKNGSQDLLLLAVDNPNGTD